MRRFLGDEAATRKLGADLATACTGSVVAYLQGELGAGKSTFVRGFLASRGYQGAVKSPTYTLVEPYELAEGTVLHLDLYRLSHPEELEYLGIRDLADPSTTLLVEWPEQGHGFLPPADIVLTLEYRAHGREANVVALTARGSRYLAQLAGTAGPS